MQHTKGPWVVNQETYSDPCNESIYAGMPSVYSIDVDGVLALGVAQVCDLDPDEAQANANLIAAAPELYSVLEEVSGDIFLNENNRLHILIEKTLAKARGEKLL